VAGVKTASRIDPAAIEKKAGPVFELKGSPGEWTSIEAEAARARVTKEVRRRSTTGTSHQASTAKRAG
jgi:hypothetical protein